MRFSALMKVKCETRETKFGTKNPDCVSQETDSKHLENRDSPRPGLSGLSELSRDRQGAGSE